MRHDKSESNMTTINTSCLKFAVCNTIWKHNSNFLFVINHHIFLAYEESEFVMLIRVGTFLVFSFQLSRNPLLLSMIPFLIFHLLSFDFARFAILIWNQISIIDVILVST